MTKETRVTLVDSAVVMACQPLVERMLRGVVFSSPMLYTIDQVFERLREGKMQLWLFHEPEEEPHLFAITKIDQYPAGSIGTVFCAAGKRMRVMIDWSPQFELWCKMQGADYVHFQCNEKLLRIMKRRGYVATAYAVYKPLRVAN